VFEEKEERNTVHTPTHDSREEEEEEEEDEEEELKWGCTYSSVGPLIFLYVLLFEQTNKK